MESIYFLPSTCRIHNVNKYRTLNRILQICKIVFMSKSQSKQYIDPESLSLFRQTFWEKCKASGITLEDLAERTDLSYIQIFRIVRGKNNTSLSNVMAVIKAAEFQPFEIFTFNIEIPDYPPLRKYRQDKKLPKSPGAIFYLRAYIENGVFEGKSFTPAEFKNLVNSDLDSKFSDKDFSVAFSKIFNGLQDKNPLKRVQEGSSYRYFLLSEDDKDQLLSDKRKMKRTK